MNMYSIAKSIRKEMKKWIDEITGEMTIKEKIEFLTSDDYKQLELEEYEKHLKEFEVIANIEIDIRERYKKVVEERGYKNQDKLLDVVINIPDELKKAPKHNYILDITPPENTKPETVLSFTNEVIKEIDLKNIEMAIEQRGYNEETKFKGIHTHANIITNSTETLDKLKKKCKNILEKYKFDAAVITFKTFGTMGHLWNREKYIRGNKVGVDKDGIEKMLKIPFDKELRKKLEIPDIITIETLNVLEKFKMDSSGTGGSPSPGTPPVKITQSNIKIQMS